MPSGSPRSWRSQSSVTSSSSCSAGDVRQRIPTWFSAGREQLGEDAGLRARDGEVGEVARALPVRHAGEQHPVEVGEHGLERLGVIRWRRRERGADLARLDARQHRILARRRSRYDGDPVEGGGAVVAKALTASVFAICAHVRVLSTCSFVSQPRRACATPSSA